MTGSPPALPSAAPTTPVHSHDLPSSLDRKIDAAHFPPPPASSYTGNKIVPSRSTMPLPRQKPRRSNAILGLLHDLPESSLISTYSRYESIPTNFFSASRLPTHG